MKHKLVVEFDDDEFDANVLVRLGNVSFDGIPCNLYKDEFSELQKTHIVLANPFRMHLSVTRDKNDRAPTMC